MESVQAYPVAGVALIAFGVAFCAVPIFWNIKRVGPGMGALVSFVQLIGIPFLVIAIWIGSSWLGEKRAGR